MSSRIWSILRIGNRGDIIYLDRYHAQESANANRVYRVECPRLEFCQNSWGM
ncbi:hypothetical protein MASR2M70_03460 [Bacillota bacterium]